MRGDGDLEAVVFVKYREISKPDVPMERSGGSEFTKKKIKSHTSSPCDYMSSKELTPALTSGLYLDSLEQNCGQW